MRRTVFALPNLYPGEDSGRKGAERTGVLQDTVGRALARLNRLHGPWTREDFLVFTPLAIYAHDDWTGKSPGATKINYSEIRSRVFSDGGFAEIGLGNQQFLNVAGAWIEGNDSPLASDIKAGLT